MSGPKLSAYELEQLRKAELENIQRELAKSRAHIKAILKDVASVKEWCDRELVQFERQLNLLESSSLSQEKVSETGAVISSEKLNIANLLQTLANIREMPLEHPDELSEVQKEEHRLRGLASALKTQRDTLIANRLDYELAMSGLAENLKGSLECSTYSLAEALLNIQLSSTAPQSQSTDIVALRSRMLNEIIRIKNNPFASGRDIDRLERAAHFVEQEVDPARLKEVDSMVIREFTYKFSKMESLYGEYVETICQHNALLESLGESPIVEEKFETTMQLSSRIASLKAENSVLYERLISAATCAEINKAIDEAMCSLGYDLIGTKEASAQGSIKLYQFANGTGIQIVQKSDGAVRLKVVGLSQTNRAPDKAEREQLVHMQEEFCTAYDLIKDAFEAHGIRQVFGSEKRLPPDEQFAQIIDITEYDPNYLQRRGASIQAGKNQRISSKRMPIQTPKNLTMEG